MTPEELAERFDMLAQNLSAGIAADVLDESRQAEERMRTHFIPWRPFAYRSRPAGMLFQRSGRLKFSLRHLVTRRPGATHARFFIAPSDAHANLVASVQEFGKAHIRPRFARRLAIPVGEQLDELGVALFAGPRAARTQWALFRRGTRLFGRRRDESRGARARLQFLLRRSVSIPPRPFVGPEVATAAERLVERLGVRIVGSL